MDDSTGAMLAMGVFDPPKGQKAAFDWDDDDDDLDMDLGDWLWTILFVLTFFGFVGFVFALMTGMI